MLGACFFTSGFCKMTQVKKSSWAVLNLELDIEDSNVSDYIKYKKTPDIAVHRI